MQIIYGNGAILTALIDRQTFWDSSLGYGSGKYDDWADIFLSAGLKQIQHWYNIDSQIIDWIFLGYVYTGLRGKMKNNVDLGIILRTSKGAPNRFSRSINQKKLSPSDTASALSLISTFIRHADWFFPNKIFSRLTLAIRLMKSG